MGLCCSCLEDDTRPYQGGQSNPPFVYTEQPRQQRPRQMHTANHFLAPATTSNTTTVRVVQHSSNRTPNAGHTNNGRNLLIEPGVAVRIAPRTVTQQVTILEVNQCDACGQSDHTKASCRYRERLCFYCREEGHIISVCPAKRRQQQRKQAQRRRQHSAKR